MKKAILLFLLWIVAFRVTADNHYLHAFVFDASTQETLEYANVCLMTTDSTIISQSTAVKREWNTIADFKLDVQHEGKYIIRCTMMGYNTYYKDIDIKFSRRSSKVEVGDIFMIRKPINLKEVTVKASKIKMVVKGDTVVYNADAFQMTEGSMLDALIEHSQVWN